ncbi:MAG: hypothetical protein NZ524_10325 [Thiobacillaceae bacterium]|nr:hypothetical protein [Thiobacillaceae bacterium]MCX7672586.1 hypothetical protein [Thiobacillaceae bacterium]
MNAIDMTAGRIAPGPASWAVLLAALMVAMPVDAVTNDPKARAGVKRVAVKPATAPRVQAVVASSQSAGGERTQAAGEIVPPRKEPEPVAPSQAATERSLPALPSAGPAAGVTAAVAPSSASVPAAPVSAAPPAPAVVSAGLVAPQTVVAEPPKLAPGAKADNPYLTGWYRPVSAAALPAMAVGQLNQNARVVSDAVTSLPAKLTDALPKIKTVHPTGGRELVVANLKCPAELVAGQYFAPANALREGINGLLHKLNDAQWLKFDIQLVCS